MTFYVQLTWSSWFVPTIYQSKSSLRLRRNIPTSARPSTPVQHSGWEPRSVWSPELPLGYSSLYPLNVCLTAGIQTMKLKRLECTALIFLQPDSPLIPRSLIKIKWEVSLTVLRQRERQNSHRQSIWSDWLCDRFVSRSDKDCWILSDRIRSGIVSTVLCDTD